MPLEDQTGRTAWFDWGTYTGGRRDDKAIQVELVTVPGQDELNDRRQNLIEWGEVVVFVADTEATAFDTSVAKFDQLRNDLHVLGDRPVVVIANKRDLDDCVPMDEVKHRLQLQESETVIEGIATSGGGLREVFILAVRAALSQKAAGRNESSTERDLRCEMEAALLPQSVEAPEPVASQVIEPDADLTAVDAADADRADVDPVDVDPVDADLADVDPADMSMASSYSLSTHGLEQGSTVLLRSDHWKLVVDIVNGDAPSQDRAVVEELLAKGLIVGDAALAADELSTEVDKPVTTDAGTPEAEVPQALTPDPVEPEAVAPFSAALEDASSELEDAASEAVAPDSVSPEAIAPDSVAPEAVSPEAIAPDSVAPDSVAPEAIAPDSVAPEAVAPADVATNAVATQALAMASIAAGQPAAVETASVFADQDRQQRAVPTLTEAGVAHAPAPLTTPPAVDSPTTVATTNDQSVDTQNDRYRALRELRRMLRD